MDSKEVLQYLAQLERQLIKAYGSTYATVIEIAEVRRAIENGESFKWSDNKATAAKVDKLLKKLIEKVKTLIANGIMASYNNGAKNIDGMLVKALGIRQTKQKQVVTEICKAATAKQREMGMTASARLNARRGGIQASAAIWQQNAKKELEIIIQNGISEGKSPKAIATSIRGYLLEPHRYEQSVLNKETGKLERSEAAKNYHPGQGVYRSSYKNALRMARTEMTEAYRAAEWESYQNNPLIKAYEIRLSGNHTTKKIVKGKSTVVPLTDICDKLTGVYPKTFKWTGWHPQCRCVMIPITCSQKEFRELLEARKKDHEDKKQGKEAKAVKKLEQQAANKPLPKQFTDWIRDNQERIDLAKKNNLKLPQWIVENENIAIGETTTIQTSPNAPITLTLEQLKSWLENELKVSQEIGVEMGKQMSFEEANESKGNPNYSSGGGFRINCQSCVVANELRRRGFDVEAQKNTGRKGNLPNELSYKTNWAWIDPKTGKMPNKVSVSSCNTSEQNILLRNSKKTFIENFDNATSEPGRYHIDWCWNGQRSGHIITFERLKDGTGRLYDPQTGKTHTWDDYITVYQRPIGEVSYFEIKNVRVLRVDNMEINTSIIKGIVTKAGSIKVKPKKELTSEELKLKKFLSIYKKYKKGGWEDERIFEIWKKIGTGVTDEFINEFKQYISTKKIRIGTVAADNEPPISPLSEAIKQRRKNILANTKENLTKQTFKHPKIDKAIKIYVKGIKEWLNQPHKHYSEKNEMLLNIGDILNKSTYKGYNTYKGFVSHIFETILCGEKTWIIVTEQSGRGLAIHSISDNADVLNGIKKPF